MSVLTSKVLLQQFLSVLSYTIKQISKLVIETILRFIQKA